VNTRTPKAPWAHTAFAGVVAALLFVTLAYFLDFLFAIPDDAASMDILPGLLDEASGVIVPVTVTWLALNAPWIFQLDFSNQRAEAVAAKQDQHAAPPSSEIEQSSRFLKELRNRASGNLISISSELHYLRVVTTDTEVMFLYNLKDAIEELPENSGVQVHRSHWVAREHIKQLTKKNGNSVCILSNGSSLPVSRRKYAEVKVLLAS
jgi:DNA-binding LytR/AlgR family response regulator